MRGSALDRLQLAGWPPIASKERGVDKCAECRMQVKFPFSKEISCDVTRGTFSIFSL